MTTQESAEYEGWERDWKERFANPDGWERRRAEELQSARLVREAHEAESKAAWAAFFHRPPWKRNSFSLDEASRNVRVPGQAGFDDAASDRILIQLFASLLHHDFDGNVLIWTDEPPHLIFFDPEDARWLQERGHDIDAAAVLGFGFARSLFLTRVVLKRWCEHNGLVLPSEWLAEEGDLPNGLTEQPDHDDVTAMVRRDEQIKPTRRPRGPRVESGRGAVAVGRAYLLPPLSSGGALVARP
jgi:hypothetical protein